MATKRISIAEKVSKQRTLQNVDTITYTVDAKGRALGRVASEAASALLGKKSVQFIKSKVLPVEVTITNAGRSTSATPDIREVSAPRTFRCSRTRRESRKLSARLSTA
jgi:ribosomal protein L13